jgi:hypothetical protein
MNAKSNGPSRVAEGVAGGPDTQVDQLLHPGPYEVWPPRPRRGAGRVSAGHHLAVTREGGARARSVRVAAQRADLQDPPRARARASRWRNLPMGAVTASAGGRPPHCWPSPRRGASSGACSLVVPSSRRRRFHSGWVTPQSAGSLAPHGLASPPCRAIPIRRRRPRPDRPPPHPPRQHRSGTVPHATARVATARTRPECHRRHATARHATARRATARHRLRVAASASRLPRRWLPRRRTPQSGWRAGCALPLPLAGCPLRCPRCRRSRWRRLTVSAGLPPVAEVKARHRGNGDSARWRACRPPHHSRLCRLRHAAGRCA